MASLALGIGALASGITGSILGSNASKSAANTQSQAAQNALNFQQQVYADQKANQQPYLQAGSQSIAQLMQAIQAGKFGVGSLGDVPNAPGAFTAPTLEEARNTPGYQFTAQQGAKGILQGASAAGGGAVSGGTLKALEGFNSGLADNTYGSIFNRALQGYGANLQDYSAQLAGFQTKQSAQQQAFNQLLAPATLGENAVAGINNSGTQAAQNVGNLMTQQGNAQAAGTVGSANAITGGINNAISGVTQSVLLGSLLKSINGGGNFSPNFDGLSPSSTTPPFKAGPIPDFTFPNDSLGNADFSRLGPS